MGVQQMSDETSEGFIAHRRQFGLTPEEAQVLLLLLDLKCTREITCRLDMREDEVGLHMRSLYRKHEVSTLSELIVKVRGLLD